MDALLKFLAVVICVAFGFLMLATYCINKAAEWEKEAQDNDDFDGMA